MRTLARLTIAFASRIPGTYPWAVTKAQAGHKVRRAPWCPAVWLCWWGDGPRGEMLRMEIGGKDQPASPSARDALATDWQLC